MDFLALAQKRYSCRKYQAKALSREDILKVIEAGRIAPSAVNFQPWHFIVVQDATNLDKLYQTYKRDWLKTAPAILVLCADYSQSWKRKDGKDHGDIDVAIAADHMTLQASALGLATCWVCNFDKEMCSDILGLPKSIEPLVYLPLGYPDDEPNPLHFKRKHLNEIIHWNKFENED
jgi:nitroreductase